MHVSHVCIFQEIPAMTFFFSALAGLEMHLACSREDSSLKTAASEAQLSSSVFHAVSAAGQLSSGF